MNGLEKRIQKMEEVITSKDSLTFRGFFREFLNLIAGRSRCLPCQDREHDPQFDQAFDALFTKYSNQPSEEGRRQFQEDLAKFCNSLPDDEGESRELAL